MDNDPLSQFFPNENDVDLYSVLALKEDASMSDVKKAYHRLALQHHPDKQVPTADKATAALKFQQIGFAYAVLGDEKRRKRYDETGLTDEGIEGLAEGAGWDAYFEQVFERVTRHGLDEMKKEYQGSPQEVDDLKQAYTESKGSIADIMTRIPHCTHNDEARFIVAISELIEEGKLPSLSWWKSSTNDEKARSARKKESEKEAAEAEKLARELGIWDEFYGSGKAGTRKGKAPASKEDEDVSALQALILKKKQNAGSFLDNLAAKYMPEDNKKRKSGTGPERPGSRKRMEPPEAPDIDDDEFEKLQDKLFGSRDDKPTPKSRAKRQKQR